MFAQSFEYVKLYVNTSYDSFIHSLPPQVNNLHHGCLLQAHAALWKDWSGALGCCSTVPPSRVALTPAASAAMVLEPSWAGVLAYLHPCEMLVLGLNAPSYSNPCAEQELH